MKVEITIVRCEVCGKSFEVDINNSKPYILVHIKNCFINAKGK